MDVYITLVIWFGMYTIISHPKFFKYIGYRLIGIGIYSN